MRFLLRSIKLRTQSAFEPRHPEDPAAAGDTEGSDLVGRDPSHLPVIPTEQAGFFCRPRCADAGLRSGGISLCLLFLTSLRLYFISSKLFSMDPVRELGRTLLVLGGLLVLVGGLLYFGGKLPFRLGRLPGDIVYRGEHTTLYFPIVTCLLLSAALSLLFWLFSHFRR